MKKIFESIAIIYVFAIASDAANAQSCSAPPANPDKDAEKTFLDKIGEGGLHLCRSTSGGGRSQGAAFSLLQTFDEGTVFNADFALTYQLPGGINLSNNVSFYPLVSVEGHLASSESESQDALQFRAGGELDFTSSNGSGLFVSPTISFESDQAFDNQRVFFETQAYYADRNNFLAGKPIGKEGSVRIVFEPSIALNVGHNIRSETSTEVESTILRIIPQAQMIIALDFIRDTFGFHDTFITLNEQFYYLPLEQDELRNFFQASIDFQVVRNLSVGLNYRTGQPAPVFEDIDTLGLNFAIRF